jgi:excisionase family DNA binding protein
MLDTQPRYMTVNEVAHRFNLHPVSVYRLIKAGELKAMRLGTRALRVRPEDAEQLLTERNS